jgi:hypothetical protein
MHVFLITLPSYFVFLLIFLDDSCEEMRDPHSVKWIEDFLETKNLLEFHGTGLNFLADVRWDAPLLAMLDQPKDQMIVSAKRRGRGHGGWSKNNPYLEERFVEFKINIDPASLTDRILAVREQIGAEWVIDLEILGRANQQILDSYFQIAKDERKKLDSDISTTTAFERTAVNAVSVLFRVVVVVVVVVIAVCISIEPLIFLLFSLAQ